MRTLRDFLTTDLIILAPDDSVWKAIQDMRRLDKTSVLVVEAGKPVGLFTERDLFKKVDFAGPVELDRWPIKNLMTAQLITIEATASDHEAIELMRQKGFRHLPVTEDGRILGIVSLRNLLYRHTDELSGLLDATLRSLSTAIGKKDPYTAGHQGRVAEIARLLAQALGLSEQETRAVLMASLVHDIGKLYVPTEILSKPGRLAGVEFALIKEHSGAGFDILSGIEFQAPIAEYVRQHHERLDGSGYPRGLRGDELLLPARIIAVADVYEAITAHRPYRASLGSARALEELHAQRGKHFDPVVVDVLVRIQGKLPAPLDTLK